MYKTIWSTGFRHLIKFTRLCFIILSNWKDPSRDTIPSSGYNSLLGIQFPPRDTIPSSRWTIWGNCIIEFSFFRCYNFSWGKYIYSLSGCTLMLSTITRQTHRTSLSRASILQDVGLTYLHNRWSFMSRDLILAEIQLVLTLSLLSLNWTGTGWAKQKSLLEFTNLISVLHKQLHESEKCWDGCELVSTDGDCSCEPVSIDAGWWLNLWASVNSIISLTAVKRKNHIMRIMVTITCWWQG